MRYHVGKLRCTEGSDPDDALWAVSFPDPTEHLNIGFGIEFFGSWREAYTFANHHARCRGR